MNNNQIENVLRGIYYDHSNPNSFSTAAKLYYAAKEHLPNLTLNEVKDWLSGEFTYTLHKPIRKNFKRNHIVVESIDQQWEADLVDMQEFKRVNKGFNYIITIVDVMSKFAWVQPLKDKTGVSIVKAFENVLKSGRRPQYIRTDQGKEFLNKNFKLFLKENSIYHFTSNNATVKCAIVERFNRTLKGRMFKYFTSVGHRKWYNILQDLVQAYNNSIHKSIKLTPVEASTTESSVLFKKLYGFDNLKQMKQHLKVDKIEKDDDVRQRYKLGPFDKSYYPNWTDEIYKVDKIIPGVNKPVFKVKDESNKVSKYNVYPEEIQKVKPNLYRIEKILKKRTFNGKKQCLIKWLNYPSNYNSWVNDEDIVKLS